MWAENDFLPPGQPRLDSLGEPGDNKVYTMYHGTSKQAAAIIWKTGFKQSSGGMLGRGVYLSRDLQKASRYPLELDESERVILKVRVNVGKVIKIDHQGHPLQYSWHDRRFDTAWVPPKCGMVKSGLEEDCVWDPNRIIVVATIYPGQPQPANGLKEVLKGLNRDKPELKRALLQFYRALIALIECEVEFRRANSEWSRAVDRSQKALGVLCLAANDSNVDLNGQNIAASELERANDDYKRACINFNSVASDHARARSQFEREFNTAASEYNRIVSEHN